MGALACMAETARGLVDLLGPGPSMGHPIMENHFRHYAAKQLPAQGFEAAEGGLILLQRCIYASLTRVMHIARMPVMHTSALASISTVTSTAP